MFVFQFVSLGRHAGKTSIIVELVKFFRGKGLRVGVVKHSHSYDPSFDLRGREDAKDTVRFTEAGSDVTVAVTDKLTVTITGAESLEKIIDDLSSHVDVVLLESFKEDKSYPRVIVAEEADEVPRLLTSSTVAVTGGVAVSCYEELKRLYPSITVARSVEELAGALYSFMVEKAAENAGGNCGACGYPNCEDFIRALRDGMAKPTACPKVSPRVSVHLDGRPLPLNPFVQSIIENTLRGMLSSLKGVGKPRKIEVFISSPPEG